VRGIVKFNLLDLEGALSDFNAAHLLRPTNSSILRYIGEVKFQNGQTQEALADINKALELDPQNSSAYR
jgi:Flp pilus assembly protein TadD